MIALFQESSACGVHGIVYIANFAMPHCICIPNVNDRKATKWELARQSDRKLHPVGYELHHHILPLTSDVPAIATMLRYMLIDGVRGCLQHDVQEMSR